MERCLVGGLVEWLDLAGTAAHNPVAASDLRERGAPQRVRVHRRACLQQHLADGGASTRCGEVQRRPSVLPVVQLESGRDGRRGKALQSGGEAGGIGGFPVTFDKRLLVFSFTDRRPHGEVKRRIAVGVDLGQIDAGGENRAEHGGERMVWLVGGCKRPCVTPWARAMREVERLRARSVHDACSVLAFSFAFTLLPLDAVQTGILTTKQTYFL